MSDEMRKRIVRMYVAENMSLPAIEAATGVSRGRITRAVIAAGHKMRTRAEGVRVAAGRSADGEFGRADEVVRLYVEEKLNYVQIGQRLGLSASTVRLVFIEAGGKPRTCTESWLIGRARAKAAAAENPRPTKPDFQVRRRDPYPPLCIDDFAGLRPGADYAA